MSRTTTKTPRTAAAAAPRTTINCPAAPEDYRRFKAGAALLGLDVRSAFAEASRMWLEKRCPIVIGQGEGRGV